jgi:hypothetical protein
VAPLCPAARVRRRREGWPQRGTRGSGTSLGAIRVVWRVRPWPSSWHRGTRERRPRQGGLTAALDCSGEQSREQQRWDNQINGTGGLLALRGSVGVAKQRRRHKDSTGRRRRDSGGAKIAQVSVEQTQQRGKGHTEGCPEQLTARRSSPWHWTGRGRDGGRITGCGRWRAVAELSARVGRARERARGFGKGRKSKREGGRAGRRAQKGHVGADVAGERTNVGTSTAGDRGREVEDKMTGGDDGTERESGHARGKQVGPTEHREREGEVSALGSAPTCGARLLGTGGTQARARAGLSGPAWAEIGFLFFQRFSNCFSIYFLYDFQFKFKSSF